MAVQTHSLHSTSPLAPARAWLDFSEHESWPDSLAAMAATRGVSDIFLTSRGRFRLKLRGNYIEPSLHESLTGAAGWASLCALIHAAAPEMGAGEFAREGGVEIGAFRYRVSRVRHLNGEEFTLRVLPSRVPTPREIHLPERLVDDFTALREGLVLFAGSTGNGKSTSIASLIGENARRKDVRIVTVEDPVEYLQDDRAGGSTFTYREVGAHTESFAMALREAMRMHPDIIVVGEIRDSAAARVALEAAMTGHKVVSTIHGGDVEQAMQRMGDLAADLGTSGVGALAQAFKICVAQRLVSSNGPGSPLVAIHEVLTTNESVRSKIRASAFFKLKQDMEAGSKHGMQTFQQSALSRQANGLLVV